jgi:hypothetical protein
LNDYTFENIWPTGISQVTEEQILGLSNHDFAKLSDAMRKRLRLEGHTRRAAIESVRRLKRARSKRTRAHARLIEQELLSFEFRESPLLNSFQPDRSKKWVEPSKRKLTKTISAADFSLVDNPRETINTLSEIVKFEGLSKSARLNFTDTRVLDVAPYLLLGMLSDRMAPYILGGKISASTQKVLDAVGLRDFLGIQPFKNKVTKFDVWPFPVKRRHTTTEHSQIAGESISFQKLADNLVETVNQWLATLPAPRTLSGEAMGQIANIATETLNNSERHSRADGAGDWIMAGFMALRPVEKEYADKSKYDHENWYDCHLAFVNRGRPISEAVLTTPRTKTLAEIKEYQATHSKRFGERGCSDETLATVFAMQDDISSKPNNAGGKGMMTVIEVTNELSLNTFPHKKPKITILSGKSCVMFSDEYCSFSRSSKERSGRTQLFNSSQSIEIGPSSEHVFDLDVDFPGTVIAVRFTLDPNTMEALNDDP